MRDKPRKIFDRYMRGDIPDYRMARTIYTELGGITNIRDGGDRLLLEGQAGNTAFRIDAYRGNNPGKLGTGIKALERRAQEDRIA